MGRKLRVLGKTALGVALVTGGLIAVAFLALMIVLALSVVVT